MDSITAQSMPSEEAILDWSRKHRDGRYVSLLSAVWAWVDLVRPASRRLHVSPILRLDSYTVCETNHTASISELDHFCTALKRSNGFGVSDLGLRRLSTFW